MLDHHSAPESGSVKSNEANLAAIGPLEHCALRSPGHDHHAVCGHSQVITNRRIAVICWVQGKFSRIASDEVVHGGSCEAVELIIDGKELLSGRLRIKPSAVMYKRNTRVLYVLLRSVYPLYQLTLNHVLCRKPNSPVLRSPARIESISRPHALLASPSCIFSTGRNCKWRCG